MSSGTPVAADGGRKVVVLFSTGRGSFAAAVRARAEYDDVHLLLTDTLAEDADNYRFMRESVDVLGLPFHHVVEGRTPWQVAHDEHMIPNSQAKICSRVLKQEPGRKWLNEHAPDALVVLGIGWWEAHRLPAIEAGHKPRDVWAPLTEPPYLDAPELDELIRAFGVEPPRMYRYGYPHANCAGACFLAGQAQWAMLLRDSPDLYAANEAEEERFRAERGNYAILRDRTGGTTTPLPLKALRERIEAGGQYDLFDVGGCGCTPGDAGPVLQLTAKESQ